ncbi:MAG TPA: hypothetical protein VJ732_10255, partial [Bryobacteraceae bacterium]|nr:hypothetical protein [Bryobacteraceae bacterium]
VVVATGGSQQFVAYVNGGSGDTSVTWKISPSLGSIGATGLYTAPGSATNYQAVTVTATSVADPRQSANAYIKLTAGTSAVTSLGPLQSHRFSLADSSAAQSGWVLDPPLGMLTGDGLYIAPVAIDATREVSVGLSGGASKTAAGVVTLLRAGISPAETDLAPGEAVHFVASFARLPPEARWAIEPVLGTISPVTGLYIAPAKIPEPRSVRVTATSALDPSQISIARIQLWPSLAAEDSAAEPALRYRAAARPRSGGADRPSLRVEPESATLEPGQPVPFRLVDSGGNALDARWRLVPPLGSISASGEYRAPEGLMSASMVAVIAEPISFPGRQAAAAVRLMAAAPELLRFTCSRSSSQAVCEITLSVAAPAHGVDIAIGAAPGDAVIAPSSWQVPGGSRSGIFPVTVLASGARLTATLGTTLQAEIPE